MMMINSSGKKIKDKVLIISFIFLFILSCLHLPAGMAAQATDCDSVYEVFVVQQRWHTGIIFNTKDIDPEIWPEIEHYKNRKFVDVGWGDEKFYQAYGIPVLLAARAILFPTRSVLQVYAFSTEVRAAYGGESRILKIHLNRDQLDSLSRFVSESYIRDEDGEAQTSTVYGEADHYFLATRKYHLFRTCNTWVANGFSHSGFDDVRTFCVLNANQLFRQLSDIPDSEFLD